MAWVDKAAFLAERRPVGELRDGLHSVAEWRESAYLDEETLENRLASARLGSAEFAHLVSGGDFEVDAKSAEWVKDLRVVLSSAQPVPELRGVIISLYGQDYDRVPFLGFTWPFLSAYGAELRSRAGEARWRLPLTERAVVTALSDLATGLTEIAHRTLIIDLHEARTAGRLTGSTPQARYTDYDERILAEPATRERILAEHPVLARELLRCAGQWLTHSTEVLDRLSADLPALRAAGLLAGTSAVSALRPGLGDPHGNGRSVTKLEFEDGQSLIYKPRSVAPERVYAEAVAWLDERTGVGLEAMPVLPRPGYGWCGYLEHRACRDTAGFARFYRRTGVLLAALHVLGGVDVHMTNLIAVGDSPVPVDLETLLQHTSVRGLGSDRAHERAVDLLAQSVLATLVVPVRTFGDGVRPGVDVSAIGGGLPSRTPKPVPAVVDPFTDVMRIVGEHRETKPARNRPHVDGRPANPADYVEEVRCGFLLGYDAVLADREDFGRLLDDAHSVEVRYLARPTRRYDLFRLERMHPDYLRDALDTERLLDKLWTAAVTRRDLAPLVEEEKNQLRRGDIPAFHSRPGSTALYADGRVVAEDYFAEPSGTTLRRKLALLGPGHRAAQLAILSDALDTLGGATTTPVGVGGPSRPQDTRTVLHAELTELAEAALLGKDDCTWIGIGVDGVRGAALSYKPLNTTLYDGVAGMALLFGYAARHFEEERFSELSRRALRPVLAELRGIVGHGEPTRVGAFVGLAGAHYALAHMHQLTGDPDLPDLVNQSLPVLLDSVWHEQQADLVAGAAGCLVVAVDLHRRLGLAAAADVAAACVERLAATAVPTPSGIGWPPGQDRPPLGGFSHGTAGIGWALLLAAAELGDDKARELGRRALAQDRSLRIPGVDAWQDLRGFEDLTGIVQEYPTLWCHGSTGIGMSRLLAHQLDPDQGYLDEAEAALRATSAAGALGNHCLCHGDSGSLELFTLATQVLPEEARWEAERNARAESLTASVAGGGVRFGRVTGSNIPGLLLGKAGVYLTLLRQLDPSVPSVLHLQPPQGQL